MLRRKRTPSGSTSPRIDPCAYPTSWCSEHDASDSDAADTGLRRAIISRPAMNSVGALTASTACTVPSARQMEDREGAGGRIATDGGFLYIEWQPGDLQPRVVLIGPEPRHFRRRQAARPHRSAAACFACSSAFGTLSNRPVRRYSGSGRRVQSPIAWIEGSDVRAFASTMMPSSHSSSGGACKRIVRCGANAHQNRIARNGGSIRQPYR